MTASKIEWTDRSDWNPIRGCTRVSPGCGGPGPHGGCYAEAMAARFSLPGMWGHGFAEMVGGKPHWTGKVELQADRLLLPLSWKKPAKVFASSTSDLFHEQLADVDIDKLFAVVAASALTRNGHVFQILTKRPARMRDYFAVGRHKLSKRWGYAANDIGAFRYVPTLDNPIQDSRYHNWELLEAMTADCSYWPLPNLWLGVSAERQQEADERIPLLLETPAAVRFVSCEPLLGPIDLMEIIPNPIIYNAIHGMSRLVDWVIVGGESGPRARPMHPDWARKLRDQCIATGTAFFFKQWGEWDPIIDRERDDPDWRRDYSREYSNHGRTSWLNLAGGSGFHGERFHVMHRSGKAHTGALLDGREHKAFPEARP